MLDIDLNTFLHRQLAHELVGSRDKTAVAIMTHTFSVSDTFTCFLEGEFIPRKELCPVEDQDSVSAFILISSNTSLRNRKIATPNASTDGSFPKAWKYENGAWWLYKLQSAAVTCSEGEISHALLACGWDAAGDAFAGLFTQDPAIRREAVRAIRICTLAIVPLAIQYTIADGFTGMALVKYALPLSSFRKAVYFVALFLLPALFGAEVTFFAETLSDIIPPVVTTIVYLTQMPRIMRERETDSLSQ